MFIFAETSAEHGCSRLWQRIDFDEDVKLFFKRKKGKIRSYYYTFALFYIMVALELLHSLIFEQIFALC